MANRKFPVRVFLFCTALTCVISGYVIECYSMNSFPHDRRIHGNMSHDFEYARPDIECVCIQLIKTEVNKTMKSSQVFIIYQYTSVFIRRRTPGISFISRTGKTKPKPDQKLRTSINITIAGQSKQNLNSLNLIHGNHSKCNVTDHSRISVSNSASQVMCNGSTCRILDLTVDSKLFIVLCYAVIRMVLAISMRVLRNCNQAETKDAKDNTNNSGYRWKSLRYYLEHECPSIFDRHRKCKNDNSLFKDSYYKDMLRETLDISALSKIPPQTMIVAPVSQLNDYFESMTQPHSSYINVSLNVEILRLESFQTFPRSVPVSTIRLAENGFFYTGDSDEVECFHCHARYSGWRKGDNPFDVHKKISPNCDLMTGRATNNTPLLSNANSKINKDVTVSEDIHEQQEKQNINTKTRERLSRYDASSIQRNRPISSGSQQCSNTYNTITENEFRSNESERGIENERVSHINTCDREANICRYELDSLPTAETFEHETGHLKRDQYSHGTSGEKRPYMDYKNGHNKWQTKYSGKLHLKPLAQVGKRMTYPAYAIPTIRLSSFKGWSSTSGLTPKLLADAGFLYAGYGDLVRCFCCGGGLRNWLPGDDPWIEHARWFPDCVYLRESKGDDFIELVHEEVKLPQGIYQKPVTGATDTSPEYVTRFHALDKASAKTEDDPFSQRVKEMGFPAEDISAAITSLRKLGKPVDVYTIVNKILGTENSFPRDGFDEVDTFQTRQTAQRTAGKTEDKEALLRNTNGTCKICLEKDACVVFLPCHHVTCCGVCSSVLLKCTVCRQAIKGRVKMSF
ncbi:E3 ubiquitin-protein ligase XIAP-like isoform X2 [Argopecten irradians]